MHKTAETGFQERVSIALKDRRLRENLRKVMDALILKRQAAFPDTADFEVLRSTGEAIKKRCLAKLPELLEQLEKTCTRNGIHVHWAETADAANHQVLDILKTHGATRLVKGKSMVSEEMHLNRFLEAHGIESLETDLGEFIIQLDHEPPSHIIAPAIHKNRDQIARTFHEKIPGAPYTEVIEELNAIARATLREKFKNAHAGLSGVNIAVAETGTLVLVENEGNGRMCTTVPPVHIAVMGIEKVVELLCDVPLLLELLTRSASGQIISTYVNMISSPRKPGEMDGPKAVHLILLDNGRTRIYADPELRQTLHCLRCGACLNHCPVYTRIGGHAYGFIYPGPIGKILTPQMEGLEKAGALSTASTLCNACEAVCPVKIPIPELIRRLRNESYETAPDGDVTGDGYRRNLAETIAWKGWRLVNTTPAANRLSTCLMGAFSPMFPQIGPMAAWTRCRTAPVFAPKSLHQLAKEQGIDNE